MIDYAIKTGEVYRISREENKFGIFYYIKINKNEVEGKKRIIFNEGIDVVDGTNIRILEANEDYYYPRRTPYNAVWILNVTNFEEVIEISKKEALNLYNKEEQDYDKF